MKKIKAVIVDDETLARKRIRKLLFDDDEIEIAGEFEKGADALKFLKSNDVDIAFLDIHMPEIDGFAVLQKLSSDSYPFVIFATADKESAIKAFEYNAIDYLLKPFRNSRFQESLEKAKEYVRIKNKAAINDQLVHILDKYKGQNSSTARFDNGEEIDFSDVLYIKADGNYLRLYRAESDYQLLRLTVNEMVDKLADHDFLRIHRSILINTYFIEAVLYVGNNEFEFKLKDSSVLLKSGRSFKKEIDQYRAG